jgi:hypothetical protein
MRERRLSKNKKLHWWNWFEEFFAHLKAARLGTLVFRRAWGKKICSPYNFRCQKLEAKKKNFCAWPLMEPSSMKFRSSMRSLEVESKNFCSTSKFSAKSWRLSKNILNSAFYGALEHEARELHERLSLFFLAWPPIFGTESWRPNKEILCLTSHGAFEHKTQEFHERLNNKIWLGLSWSSQAWCSRDPWEAELGLLLLMLKVGGQVQFFCIFLLLETS